MLDREIYLISSAAADQNACKLIIERAGTSISEAVKAANKLKNTLSEPYADVLAVTDSRHLRGGAIFGLLHYIPQRDTIFCSARCRLSTRTESPNSAEGGAEL